MAYFFFFSYFRTTFAPTSFHHFNSSLRLDYPELNDHCPLTASKYSTPSSSREGEFSLRPRCLPRKRRAVLHNQQPQQWTGSSNNPSVPQNKLLSSPSVCVPTTRDLYSPPVSPKTLIPIAYPQPQQQPQQQSTSPTALRPCHICHRRPTTREVLDAYAGCDLCGERTCYICLRQCDSANCCGSVNLNFDSGGNGNRNLLARNNTLCSSHGTYFVPDGDGDGLGTSTRHQRKVCSWCAVEGVTETGIEVVRCLDCVRGQISQWQDVPPGPIIPIRNGM